MLGVAVIRFLPPAGCSQKVFPWIPLGAPPITGQPRQSFLPCGKDLFIPLFRTKNINVLFPPKDPVPAVFHLAV